MRDTPIDVKSLTEELSALWREVAALSPKWSVPLTALERAHRELAQREAALPGTQRIARHRRQCVEALQAEKRDVEAQLAQLHSTTSALTGLVSRHLTTARDALDEAAAVQRLQCSLKSPGHDLWVLFASGIACVVTWLVTGHVPLLLIFVLAVGTSAITRVRLEFDGRSLRVSRRLLGLRCSPTRVVDLARFDQVDEFPFEVASKEGRKTQHVRLTLRGPDRELEVGTREAGADADRIGRQLREWCACAARERC